MTNQIEFIEDINLKFNQEDDYKLLGLWPQIMGRVHILDVSIDGFFIRKSIQSRLDAFLFNKTESLSTGLIESGIIFNRKTIRNILVQIIEEFIMYKANI